MDGMESDGWRNRRILFRKRRVLGKGPVSTDSSKAFYGFAAWFTNNPNPRVSLSGSSGDFAVQVCELYKAYRRALWIHARVALNRFKTHVWNAAGEEPPGISALQQDLDAAVWVGDWALPPTEQGLTVLGTPFGNDAYI